VSSVRDTVDLRRCVTSPPNDGVARQRQHLDDLRKIADATRFRRRRDDAMKSAAARQSPHLSWPPQSDSEADRVDGDAAAADATVFISNNCVKFQLGHDDDSRDVIVRDVIASI